MKRLLIIIILVLSPVKISLNYVEKYEFSKLKLGAIIGKSKSDKYYPYIKEASERFMITNKLRLCHFLSNCSHETQGFTLFVEKTDGKKYEYSEILGNNEAGDGFKYRGRTAIHLTGKYWYKKASEYFEVDFVSNPELLEQKEWAFLVAAWFWKINSLNSYADLNNMRLVVKKINPSLNGYSEREALFEKFRLYL